MIGANDPQGLVTPTGSIQYGQPGWDDAYSARVAAFIAEANPPAPTSCGWGCRPCRTRGSNAELVHLNSLVQAQVPAGQGRGRLPVVGALAGRPPRAATPPTCPKAVGAEINIRTPDGIHLSPGGGPGWPPR